MSRIGPFADDDAAAWVVKSPDIGAGDGSPSTSAVYNKNRLPMRVRELARMVIALDNECVVCQNTRDSDGHRGRCRRGPLRPRGRMADLARVQPAGADRRRVRRALRQRSHRPARRRGLLGTRERAVQRRTADRPGTVVRDVVGHGPDAADAGHRPDLQDHALIHSTAAQNGCCDIAGSQTPRRGGHRPTRIRRGRHRHRHGRQPRRPHSRQDRSAPENGRVRRSRTGRQPGLARLRHRPDRHRVRRGHRRGRRSADPYRPRRAAHPRRRIGLGARRFLRSGRPAGSRLQPRTLDRVETRLADAGIDALVGHEIEFLLVGPDGSRLPADLWAQYGLAGVLEYEGFVRDVTTAATSSGVVDRAVPPRVRHQPVRDLAGPAVPGRRGRSAGPDADHHRPGRPPVRPAGQPLPGAVRRQRGIWCTPTLFAAERRHAAVLRRHRRAGDDAGGGARDRRAAGGPAARRRACCAARSCPVCGCSRATGPVPTSAGAPRTGKRQCDSSSAVAATRTAPTSRSRSSIRRPTRTSPRRRSSGWPSTASSRSCRCRRKSRSTRPA